MRIIPQVSKETSRGERAFDLYSRLLDDRIIMLDGEVNDETASLVIAQLLYLESKQPNEDIFLYINSPGGCVSSGLGIVDTIDSISCDVHTIGTGLSASMGAVILACGTKGKRHILPHAEVMIHQPLGGAKGQATDILIASKHIEKTRNILNGILAERTGQDIDTITRDTERDNWLDANEAIAYGLVDNIVEKRKG